MNQGTTKNKNRLHFSHPFMVTTNISLDRASSGIEEAATFGVGKNKFPSLVCEELRGRDPWEKELVRYWFHMVSGACHGRCGE
jgi:hypothetical protein